ncbi:MAG TPA: ABC transporter substrate-binding protein [Candidatus Didemnitutus sp.]|nr:ABC transporter substrate-binding protein [Candidatus Didemnitutus sp.]
MSAHLRSWLTGLFVLALPASGWAAPDLHHVVLQLPFTHSYQFAGYYAAQYKGFYAAEGLDVQLRQNLKSGPSVTEVTDGRASYGVYQGPGLLARWMENRDVVVLAAVMQHSPFGIAVLADSDIHGPKDLLTCRLAIDSSRLAAEVKLMMEKEGLDVEKLHVVPNRWGIDELGAGTADAMDMFIMNRPDNLQYNRGEKWRWILPRDYGVDFYGDCLYARRGYFESHRAEAQAMKRASMRGWEYALAHPVEVRNWILTSLPERPPGQTSEMLDYGADKIRGLIDADFVEIGHMNPGRWQIMADAINHFLPSLPHADIEGFIVTEDMREPLPAWVRWMIWVLGMAAAGIALALFANRRLRRLVEKRAEELRASEERMRHFIENSNVGIYRSTPDGRLLFANAALVRMMGYDTFAELATRNLEREGYEPSYSRRHFRETLEANGMVNGLEAEWRKRDGTVIFVRESANIVRGSEGDIRFYDGIIEDITLRKKAELALRQSEERFRNLTAAAFEGILITEAGRIIDVNDQAARLLGYTRSELIGRLESELLDVGLFVRPDANGSAEGARFNVRFIRHDGTAFPAECQTKVMRDDARELRITAFRDITEQHLAERRQRSLEEQLRQKQKMEAVGRLAGGIAHDFNNILTGILGNIQLAEMDLPAQHPSGAALASARKASTRARELVARILAFSRLEEDKRIPASLAPIVEEAVQLLRVKLPPAITIRTLFDADCPPVNCDSSQIHQVVMNLGTNAVHALRDRGGEIVVELHRVQPSGILRDRFPQVHAEHTVCLSVSDDGRGMEPEVLQRIFEPFYTTKSFGEGTGLGLATVHAIMRTHGGAVVVDSTVGTGSTFFLYFPAAPTPAAPKVPSTPPMRAFPAAFGAGRSIFLVDDEDFVREVTASLLRRLEFTVQPFARGSDALEALKNFTGPLAGVITDLSMPEMNGLELTVRIRGLRPELPVILASGHLPAETQQAAEEAGVRLFVQKPFDANELISKLRAALG